MKTYKLDENGPVIIEPRVFGDERGYFYESFSDKEFKDQVADVTFVQDNQSKSCANVLRGLHFQNPPYAQSKLVRVVNGAVIDVAVDIRPSSPNYGKFYAVYLSEKNHKQFFIPQGFAHGFVALEDDTIFQYKCDNYYNKESEGGIAWDDPEINIPWNHMINIDNVILSEKDKNRITLKELDNKF